MFPRVRGDFAGIALVISILPDRLWLQGVPHLGFGPAAIAKREQSHHDARGQRGQGGVPKKGETVMAKGGNRGKCGQESK